MLDVTTGTARAKDHVDAAAQTPDGGETELCRLMTGYLNGEIDAFDALYAALGRPHPRLL